MQTHVKVVAILNILVGAFWLLIALLVLAIFGSIPALLSAIDEGDLPIPIDAVAPILHLVGGIVLIFLLVISVPGILAGIGLLQYREWGRILGIVVSAFNLVHVPIGTVLGVYGLWVLLNNETVQLFRGQGPPAPHYSSDF